MGDERPTLPPAPDPLMEVFLSIEERLKEMGRYLAHIDARATACFEELQRLPQLEARVKALEDARDTEPAPEMEVQ